MPDPDQHRETHGEGHEAPHRHHQILEGLGDVEGNDEQGEGEAEDRVGEALQPGNLAAAPTKVLVLADALRRQVLAQHQRGAAAGEAAAEATGAAAGAAASSPAR